MVRCVWRTAVVGLLASMQIAECAAKKKKVRKKIVECMGREPPNRPDEFDVRVIESIDEDVCDRKSEIGDTLTVKFDAMYYDDCEEFQTNKGVEFVLGEEGVLTGWNRGLQGMCEGEIRKLYLSTHDLLTSDRKEEVKPEHAQLPKLETGKTRAVIMTVQLQEVHRKTAKKRVEKVPSPGEAEL